MDTDVHSINEIYINIHLYHLHPLLKIMTYYVFTSTNPPPQIGT
jgi:hypothetical protein